jgi:hypothetical protein
MPSSRRHPSVSYFDKAGSLLAYLSGHLIFILLVSLARGWTTAVETRVSLTDMRERNEEPLLSYEAFFTISLLLQVISTFTKGALTFYNMLEASDRLPAEIAEVEENTAEVPLSNTSKVLRHGAFVTLTGTALSLLGPFIFTNTNKQIEEHFPDANSILKNSISASLSGLAMIAFLFTESREVYHDLCKPESSQSQNTPVRVKVMLAMLRLFVFSVHAFSYFFEGSSAYDLPTSEAGCPSLESSTLPLSIYVAGAASTLAFSVAIFEVENVRKFSLDTAQFWKRGTRKEQFIAGLGLLLTLGGAISHLLPSLTGSKRLLGCIGTLRKGIEIGLLSLLTVSESVLEVVIEGKAVEASLKIISNPKSIRPLTLAWNNRVDVEQPDSASDLDVPAASEQLLSNESRGYGGIN